MKTTQETKKLKPPERLTKVSKKVARVERNEKGQLQKGSILNPEGLKEGTKHFHTLMDETVEEIAKANNITKGEVWRVLLKRSYSEAKNGNYQFYKDIFDRYYGQAAEKHELDVGKIIVEVVNYAGTGKRK